MLAKVKFTDHKVLTTFVLVVLLPNKILASHTPV